MGIAHEGVLNLGVPPLEDSSMGETSMGNPELEILLRWISDVEGSSHGSSPHEESRPFDGPPNELGSWHKSSCDVRLCHFGSSLAWLELSLARTDVANYTVSPPSQPACVLASRLWVSFTLHYCVWHYCVAVSCLALPPPSFTSFSHRRDAHDPS